MDLFVVGEIVKTRGLRGCVKALSYVETRDIFDGLEFVYIEDGSGKKNHHKLRKIAISGNFLFIEIEGISDIESAQSLVGRKVYLPKDLLGELPEGEYYWRDIVGLNVYNEEGQYLGCIESIFPTGSNDVYVCKNESAEILIPAIADVVLQIDLERRIMTVKLLEGLL
jgi:16S rRNA processing protein RimM